MDKMAEERNSLGLTRKEVESELKLLESSYIMYEKTKKETERTMKMKVSEDGSKFYDKDKIDSQIQLIQNAQNDIIEKYTMLGGKVEDLNKLNSRKGRSKIDQSIISKSINNNDDNSSLTRALSESSNDIEAIRDNSVSSSIPVIDKRNAENGFDLIPLPSNGECYKNKISKLPVAPLCASDENMIASPNLYRDKLVMDYILRAKILNNEIDPLDLLEGDRDAILLYLRSEGYGNEYPITATDNKTGESFKTTVDLSKLRYKNFKLKGDANGWFSYTLPVSGDEIKFKFLTHRDIKALEMADELDDKKLVKDRVSDMVETLNFYVDNDETTEKNTKTKVRQAINTLEGWSDDMEEENTLYTHSITNRLELEIMSVNMVTDRDYIKDYVKKMKVKDSLSLRNYIIDNEPGVDFTFEVKKPESLGGGSMEVFLQLDQYIFLNI